MESSTSHSEDDDPTNKIFLKDHDLPGGKLKVPLCGKKKQLYERIKRKMRKIDSESDPETIYKTTTVKGNKKGNRNASKISRKIEVSWMHNGKSMRARSGGGSRKFTVANSSTPEEVIVEANKYFFPDGRSARGIEADQCTFELRDFSHNQIAEHHTVADMHDRVMPLGILRFHVYTTDSTSHPSSTSVSVDTMDTHTTTASVVHMPPCLVPKPLHSLSTVPLNPDESEKQFEAVDTSSLVDATYYVLEDAGTTVQEHTEKDVSMLPSDVLCFIDDSEEKTADDAKVCMQAQTAITEQSVIVPSSTATMYSPASQSYQNLPHVQASPRSPTPPPEDIHQHIYLHRSMLSEEIVVIFKDPNIINTPIKVHFIDEAGADAQGVSREAYSAFWKEFFLRSTCGECESVPVIFPEYGLEEWQAVGRILLKGYRDTGVFPLQLSFAFTVAVVHGECEVTPDILLDSFRMYVSGADRIIIDSALHGESLDEDSKEDFLDLLSRVDCHTIPDTAGIKPAILNIAHKELIQEPKYACDAIASTAREGLCFLLPDTAAIRHMYEAKTPTARKIIKLLVSEPEDKDQNSSLSYLKQFIKGLDDSMLRKFLRHFTGAEVICTPTIKVSFNKMRGFGRAPQAHTCGPLIELPSTYSSYTDLRREFISILETNYLNMDVV